ncbi:hypothetical protein G8A07_03430 [Roseateles sp. DAIF2]|uniref:hypothetical protein n=1 Tax=Roseateles sp. DAIF2 TaxID=2714952 RepID=UPI0018A2C459|nr:hypothetical protein [Roseateles sp. DAIF2]QPF72073.1 hypothetical protein G8A07_03430 [Roseateles sp. DAIF2]
MADSAAQQRAQQEAARIAAELRRRGQRGPSVGEIGMCHRDGYNITQDRLDGDFDLDEPFAQTLLQGLMAQPPGAGGPSLRPMPYQAPVQQPAPPSQWISDYLLGSPPDKSFGSQLQAATVGPGNILGTAAGTAQIAMQARAQATTGPALARATAAVSSGSTQRVRINEFMEVYNANKTGRGRPRPRLRIKGLPMKVIDATGGAAAWRGRTAGGTYTTPAAGAMRHAGVWGQQVGEARIARSPLGWSSRMPGAGILTFAPSAAIDAYNATRVDAKGMHFDMPRFAVDSARSQSGNLVGFGVSVAVTAVLVAAGVAGLPLLIIGLGVGIVAQAVWTSTGMDDKSAGLMERGLAR